MSDGNIPIILIIIARHCLENASFIVLPLLEMNRKQLTAYNRLAAFSDVFFMELTRHEKANCPPTYLYVSLSVHQL